MSEQAAYQRGKTDGLRQGRASLPTSDCSALREELAKLAHDQWTGWMEYLFEKSDPQTFREDGAVVIPSWAVERWKRQMGTPYENLSEDEKDSDRKEADRVIYLLKQNTKAPETS